MKAGLVGVAALAMVAWGSVAFAQEVGVVLLIGIPADTASPEQRRLIAELGAVDFRIEHLPSLQDQEIYDLLQARPGLCALTWSEEGGVVRARIWYTDPSTRALDVMRLEERGGLDAERGGAGELALRVAEFLHGARVEALAAPSGPPVVEEEPVALARWALGPRLGGATSGTTPWVGLVGAVGQWSPTPTLSVDVEALLSATSAEIVGEGGQAVLRLMTLRAAAIFQPWSDAALSPRFGGGAGWLSLMASGSTDEAGRDRVDLASSVLFYLRGELAWRIAPEVRLHLATALGRAWPEVPVRFSGEPVATGAGAWFDVLIGVGWGWGGGAEPGEE